MKSYTLNNVSPNLIVIIACKAKKVAIIKMIPNTRILIAIFLLYTYFDAW